MGGTAIGYSRYGTMLHRELTALGVDVFDQIDEPIDQPKSIVSYMIEEEGERRFKKTNVVAWVSVPTHARGWWNKQHAVISTMWEATELPESFRETLHNFDQVIVPSDQNVALFSRFHPNVTKVPLGIDPTVWHPVPRPEPTTTFNFLIGGSGPRKGTDLAVRAFRKLWGKGGSWGSGPEPRLILKAPKPEDHYGRGITRVGGRLTSEEEVALYASAHCYLQPSRGEGFGLQPLQAIAQGCPTILTGAHGHEAFAHFGFPLRSTLTHAGYFIYGDAGDWWEPDFDELCDSMRWVYDHYDQAVGAMCYGAEQVGQQFTWRRTAEQFIDAIGADRLAAAYQGNGTWVQPDSRMFHTRVFTPSGNMEIAGHTYQLQPGVDYWVPADVKRIVWEAGNLDPGCMNRQYTVDGHDSEIGITREQAERYMDDRHFCATCGQALGNITTKADQLFEAMV